MVSRILCIRLTVDAERPSEVFIRAQEHELRQPCAGVQQWESHKQDWFRRVTQQANRFASLGFTCIWLLPFTESVSPQGYMPLDLYNLNSCYGSEEDLRRQPLLIPGAQNGASLDDI